jgi:DNA-binding MarR family transcriptional regulator
MDANPPSLGTELRRLIELLDGDVERRYEALGLNYRPRFTPVVRALEALGPSSIKAISRHSGLSHSAASQTVAQMAKDGLLSIGESQDGRERIAGPTSQLSAMIPALHTQWQATARAAHNLDKELSGSLLGIIGEAISALHHRSFGERIAAEADDRSFGESQLTPSAENVA